MDEVSSLRVMWERPSSDRDASVSVLLHKRLVNHKSKEMDRYVVAYQPGYLNESPASLVVYIPQGVRA